MSVHPRVPPATNQHSIYGAPPGTSCPSPPGLPLTSATRLWRLRVHCRGRCPAGRVPCLSGNDSRQPLPPTAVPPSPHSSILKCTSAKDYPHTHQCAHHFHPSPYHCQHTMRTIPCTNLLTTKSWFHLTPGRAHTPLPKLPVISHATRCSAPSHSLDLWPPPLAAPLLETLV